MKNERSPHRILVATDFSTNSETAVERAALLAKTSGATLLLLHVTTPDRLADLAGLLHEAVSRASEDAQALTSGKMDEIVCRLQARHGIPAIPYAFGGAVAATITDTAVTNNADLLVVGARGENPMRDFLLGSNAERVLRKSGRPTLVVRRPPAGGYRQALVPVDFSEYSRDALLLACALAPDAAVTVLNVFDAPIEAKLEFAGVPVNDITAYRERGRRQAEADLHAFLQSLPEALRPRLVPDVEVGYPPAVILDKAAALGADLIAIGKHGRTPVEEWVLGSVTLHVLQNAACDVLAAAHPVQA